MDKILQTLGLAKRASKIFAGMDIVCEKMSQGIVDIIFIAKDASAQTIDTLEKKAFYYNVEINKTYTSEELNGAIGTLNCKVIALSDKGFYKIIKKNFEA